MAEGHLQHIFFHERPVSYPYRNRQSPRKQNYPPRDRVSHGNWLMHQFQKVWTDAKNINEAREAVALPVNHGVYLEFVSTPEYELAIRSLENIQSGIRLMNVRMMENANGKTERVATVYIPHGKEGFFLKKLRQYLEENTEKGKPRHEAFAACIDDIRLAVVESFWPYHEITSIPGEEPKWCEIWLNTDQDEDEAKFRLLASERLGIEIRDETLRFPERRVILAKVNRKQLEELIQSSDNIAEIRRADEVTSFFVELDNTTQSEWAEELSKRITVRDDSRVSVCILDTGVNNGHILIAPILKDEDCYTYYPGWGTHDHDGHGTKMSGVVGYGDLQTLLENSEPIELNHVLESVKILPPTGKNDPQLYGAITSQSISRVMIEKPQRKRIICMAVTSPEHTTGDGRPSSWSAALDELASGYIDEQQKLIIVSAGNVHGWDNYPDTNIVSSVENPAQSWNALTVGAYTEKTLKDLRKYNNGSTVAPKGGLSPYSTTSVIWDDKKWPVKPDIVLEGGNVLKDSLGCVQCEELSILTTYYKPFERQFDTIWATSAATAKAAWMAAQIQAEYPDAWPETIRGLMVHSADWTDTMKRQFLRGKKKGDLKVLLRTCGYGVPSLEKALWSMQNRVNLVVQAELQPFDRDKNGRYVMNEMHLYELPWPKDVLLSLGETEVFLRVTLSYFIEPSPGEIGWKDRYRYASCGLRFDVNGSDTKEGFLSRINAAMESDEDEPGATSVKWLLGPHNRNTGSLHSDVWPTTAAELAVSNLIAVYPVIGWWRERPWLKRWHKKIRYSLIVSLHTPEQSVDLYTPIMTEIISKVPITQQF